MTKRQLCSASFVAIVAMAGLGHAGAKAEINVFVDKVGGQFSGSLGTTRASADTSQYIGCNVLSLSGGAPQINCGARTIAGGTNGTASCTVTSQTMADTLKTITNYSVLRVFYNTTTGICTQILVDNFSAYHPMSP